jgi:hypothetical protein
MAKEYIKITLKITSAHEIYQNFPPPGLGERAKLDISGMKINHLATIEKSMTPKYRCYLAYLHTYVGNYTHM